MGGLRRLRPRARGRVRGDGGQEGGLRRARARRLAGVRPRHEHVVALRHGDGRRPRAPRARRRHALLQPGRGAPARRARADAADRRRRRSRPPGPSRRSSARPASSCATRPHSSSTGCSAARAPSSPMRSTTATRSRRPTRPSSGSASRWRRRSSSSSSGRRSRTTSVIRSTTPGPTASRSPPTLESLAEGGEPVVVEHAPRSVEEIHEAVLEALADEARHILEEGVVAEAADIDTCLILGAGFPFWLGGITKHLDQTGVSERVIGRPLAELGARAALDLTAVLDQTLRYALPVPLAANQASVNSSEGAARQYVLRACTRQTTIPTLTSDTSENPTAAAPSSRAWFGEPFLHDGRGRRRGSRSGHRTTRGARPRARGDGSRPRAAVGALEGALRAHARARASPDARSRPRTAAGTELRRHQVDALTGMLTELIAATQRAAEENGNGHADAAAATASSPTPSWTRRPTTTSTPASSTRSRSRAEFHGADPGAVTALPVPPPDGLGEDDRGCGIRRRRARPRRPDPHPPPAARLAVQARPDDRGYGDRFADASWQARSPPTRRPDHDPDVRVVRATRHRARPRDVPPRPLRRGPHRARREDERSDPRVPRAALHRHDGDRAADREAGLGRLPGLGRRPPARRRCTARPHRAAPQPPRPARGRDQLGPDRRRRLRGARARCGPRPPGAEPGGSEPLSRPLRIDARASSTRRVSSTRTTSRRSSAPQA